MAVPAIPESEDLTLPHSGEVISLQDAAACGKALAEVRSLEARIREAKGMLTAAIVAESQRQGTKTLRSEGLKLEVRGGRETVWDVDALETELLALGLPQDRVNDLIKTEVTFKVNARVAKEIAGANAEYAAVISAAQTEVEKTPYIVVSKP